MEVTPDQKTPFSKSIFPGRLNRTNFILGMAFLLFLLITAVVILVLVILPPHPTRPLSIDEEGKGFLFIVPVFLLFVVMFISLYIRRLHDLGTENIDALRNEDFRRRGISMGSFERFWTVNQRLYFYQWFYLLFLPGDIGSNQYGEQQRGIGVLQILGLK